MEQKIKQNLGKKYAKYLLELSKNSVNPNKSTLGEYLSTPIKRFPLISAQDSNQAFKTWLNLDKKKSFFFILIFIIIFLTIAYFTLLSIK
jgi:hypothetical protein